MPFKKNDENINRQGRPRGKGNKTTEELREAIKQFCEDKLPEMEKTWEQLSAKERAAFYDRLLRHILPSPVDELMRLSDTDLDKLIDKLKSERLRAV